MNPRIYESSNPNFELQKRWLKPGSINNSQFNKTASYAARLKSEVRYSKDSSGAYSPFHKREYYYDVQEMYVSGRFYDFDGINFIPANKDTVAYDNAGNWNYREYFTNQNSAWVPEYRQSRVYNNSNQPVKSAYEQYQNNQYDTTGKELFFYTGPLLDSIYSYGKQGSALQLISIVRFTHDSQNRLISAKRYYFIGGVWILNESTYYSYNVNGYLYKLYSIGSGVFSSQDTVRVDTYYQNVMGNDTLWVSEQQNTNGILELSGRQRYIYDSNSNNIRTQQDSYDNNQWSQIWTERRGFDLTLLNTDIAFPYNGDLSYLGTNKVDWKTGSYNFSSNIYEDSIYYQYDVIIGLDENGLNKIKIGPNPFQQELYLSIEHRVTIEIINLNGVTMARNEFGRGQHKWHVSHLPSGTYLIRMEGQSETKVMKFVKP